MANINDYLAWRGDVKIDSRHPFNDVDAMILARASYLPFDKIHMKRHETFRSIAEKMWDFKEASFLWPGDNELIHRLGTSARFKDMRVTDYVRRNDKKVEKQFSAITIHINKGEMYLSYIGTDDTIVGWKEDFNLAILDVIPAQQEGVDYLKRMVMKYPFKRMRIGGHSKGGNVAMYAAVTAPDIMQRRMIRIYNFDGPGLKAETEALDTGEKVLNKIHSFIPQDSIIGRLFEHTEGFTVVESTSKNVYQHDIYSWKVERDSIIETEPTKRSVFIDKSLSNWIASAPIEDRKVFINGMYEIFDNNGINTPMDLIDNWSKHIPTILKALKDTPREKRDIIIGVWKKLFDSFVEVRGNDRKKEAAKKRAEREKKKAEKDFKNKVKRVEKKVAKRDAKK